MVVTDPRELVHGIEELEAVKKVGYGCTENPHCRWCGLMGYSDTTRAVNGQENNFFRCAPVKNLLTSANKHWFADH